LPDPVPEGLPPKRQAALSRINTVRTKPAPVTVADTVAAVVNDVKAEVSQPNSHSVVTDLQCFTESTWAQYPLAGRQLPARYSYELGVVATLRMIGLSSKERY
jgi:hypothetical protein